MKAYYSDIFRLTLPDEHRFPMTKYTRLRERVLAEGVVAPQDMIVPEPATDAQILRAHDISYAARVWDGTLTRQEIRRIGFPWSPELVERSRRSSGGTMAACRTALHEGTAVNLAGGTHHANRTHGEGFCVFNDSAIAVLAMQAEGLAQRVIVIDCDVHQGNGTAAILADNADAFTFSIHGEKNYPFRKSASDLDIGLDDGTDDDGYLLALERGLHYALDLARPELAIFLAGADPFEADTLGRLSLTKAGLLARDRLVFETCHRHGVPVAVTMAGGYAKSVTDIVDIHFQTVRTAAEMAESWRAKPTT